MGRCDAETETLIPTIGCVFDDVAHTLKAEGFDASEDGTGRGTPLVPVQAFYSTESRCDNFPPPGVSPPLKVGSNGGGQPPAIAFSAKDHGADALEDLSPTLRAMPHNASHANGGGQLAVADTLGVGANQTSGFESEVVAARMSVRRLLPEECESLQGFPRGYTRIPWKKKPAGECPDGPRYKALGNSMAVPVMAWIGHRIASELARSSQKDEAA